MRGLQRAPGREDSRVSSGVGGGDRGAAIGPKLQDVVVRERLQNLAYDGAADTEQLAQRRLAQLRARGRRWLITLSKIAR